METVRINAALTTNTSQVCIGRDILGSSLSSFKFSKHSSVAIIIDETICNLPLLASAATAANGLLTPKDFFGDLVESLGISPVHILPFSPLKSLSNAESLLSSLSGRNLSRSSLLIGVGGGSLCDLVGFVASIYVRGVPWMAIPTTLLSMVDSSVGGKTAVDSKFGKNLVGSFHLPVKVIVDFAFLDTILETHWREGMAEIIKLAILLDGDRFLFFERLSQRALNKENFFKSIWCKDGPVDTKKDIADLIVWAVKTKVAIINDDLKESGCSGTRVLLNFGHTIGHALEIAFSMPHGRAVTYGILLEVEIECSYRSTEEDRFLHGNFAVRIEKTIENLFGLSVDDLDLSSSEVFSEIKSLIENDKKSVSSEHFEIVSFCQETDPSGHSKKTLSIPYAYLDAILARDVFVTRNPRPLIANPFASLPLPSSKSLTNRAILIASLFGHPQKPVVLKNILCSDDTFLMIGALAKLNIGKRMWSSDSSSLLVFGSQCVLPNYEAIISSDGATASPVAAREFAHDHIADGNLSAVGESFLDIDVGNAGTVARFLAPVCALLPCENLIIRFYGSDRMSGRPFAQIVDTFRPFNGCVQLMNKKDGFSGGKFYFLYIKCGQVLRQNHPKDDSPQKLDLDISCVGSSQFISGLIMASPLVDSVLIKIKDEQAWEVIPSLPFIKMTIGLMEEMVVQNHKFCVSVDKKEMEISCFRGSNRHTKIDLVSEYMVEPDMTSLSYPLSSAVIQNIQDKKFNECLFGSKALQDRLSQVTLQGDKVFVQHVGKLLSASSSLGPEDGDSGIVRFSFSDVGDTFMTVAVLSCFLLESNYFNDATKTIVLDGLSSQNTKECNRVCVMYENLKKMGFSVSISSDFDSMTLKRSTRALRGPQKFICIDTHNDHRIAMSFSLLASSLQSFSAENPNRSGPDRCEPLVVIENFRCVKKTWPNFWNDMSRHFGWTVCGYRKH